MTEQTTPNKEEASLLNEVISALLLQNKTLLADRIGVTDAHSSKSVERLGTTDAHPSKSVDRLGTTDAHLSKSVERLGTTDAHLSKSVERLGTMDAHPSQPVEQLGTMDAHPSQPVVRLGMTYARPSNPMENFAITNTGLSNPVERLGITDAHTSQPVQRLGIADVHLHNGKSGIMSNESQNAIPAHIKLTLMSVGTIFNLLKASMGQNMRNSALQTMALILLYLHNNQSGGHRELRKLAGYSTGGLAKLLISMRKRGMIYTKSHGRFAIAAVGKQIIAEQQKAIPQYPIGFRLKKAGISIEEEEEDD